MPIFEGENKRGKFYQFGHHKKYYYKTERGKILAHKRAVKQQSAAYANGYKGDQEGEGYVTDALKLMFPAVTRHIQGIKQAFRGTRENIKPTVRNILSKVGDVPITKIEVCRTPLNTMIRFLVGFIRKLSFLGNTPHDKLFHLFIHVKLENGSEFIFEKNQDFNIVPYKPQKNEERVDVPIHSGLTMNSMIQNTINKFGTQRILHYDAYSTNCQRFVLDTLNANNINVSSELEKFILQDVSQLVPHWAQKLTGKVTDLANKADLVVHGLGKKKVGFGKVKILM